MMHNQSPKGFLSDLIGIPLITLWPFILVVVAGALVWWWL